MENGYQIREFDNLKDASELKKMLLKFNSWSPHKNKVISKKNIELAEKQIKEFQNNGHDWCFIAVNKKDYPIGFISCHKYNNKADKYINPGDVEIESLVKKEYQGQGIGTLLKKAVFEDIGNKRKKGTCSGGIISCVEKNNNTNLSILNKLGFHPIYGSDYEGRLGEKYSVFKKTIRKKA